MSRGRLVARGGAQYGSGPSSSRSSAGASLSRSGTVWPGLQARPCHVAQCRARCARQSILNSLGRLGRGRGASATWRLMHDQKPAGYALARHEALYLTAPSGPGRAETPWRRVRVFSDVPALPPHVVRRRKCHFADEPTVYVSTVHCAFHSPTDERAQLLSGCFSASPA